jgi:hypothetical protein
VKGELALDGAVFDVPCDRQGQRSTRGLKLDPHRKRSCKRDFLAGAVQHSKSFNCDNRVHNEELQKRFFCSG